MLRHLFALMIGTLLLQPLVALASEGEDESHAMPFSDLIMTEPEERYSKETGCVAPEDEMRRNHMEYILHQRDDTMHKGIRTRQFALEECINCHAVKDEQGEYVRVEDDRHFCATCHTYTSVKIDCFECHADVPVRASKLRKLQSGITPHHSNEPFAGKLVSETLQLLTTEDQPQ
ncbi:hypothetical protein MNBD_GAMMA15-1558 [hydrothermal vent metagenome]|uniref:Uncharacterized protein n=1 Tax=hydrothermal vent metagenome TaxID=652676 RepID=A0A3B0Y700_9ZZZZ